MLSSKYKNKNRSEVLEESQITSISVRHLLCEYLQYTMSTRVLEVELAVHHSS